MMVWRRGACSLALLALLLVSWSATPVSAVYDLVERFYKAEADGSSASRLGMTESEVPSGVQSRIANFQLKWSSLSGLLQRALLWDAGYVSINGDGDGPFVQVYAPCGRTMAEIQIDISVMNSKPYTDADCKTDRCGMKNHFLVEGCEPRLTANVAQCAVNRTLANIGSKFGGVYWAEDGQNTQIPAPILRLHSDLSATDNATLYAIHLTTDTFENINSCEVLGLFIIPCRARLPGDENFCEPVAGVALDAWLRLTASSGPKTFSTTSVIVIVLLALAVVALSVYVSMLYRKRQHLKADFSPAMQLISVDHFDLRDGGDGSEDPTETNSALTGKSHILRKFVSDPSIITKRIAFSQITILRVLSKGASGEVWLGQFESRYVAMKCLLPTKRKDLRALELFSDEIRLASVLEHPRIVQFCGIAWHSLTNLSIVTEYMERGDLESFLSQPAAQNTTWAREKLALARDVADALVYLHSLAPVVIHRDLKSKNILLDNQIRAKLSDFGLSRETSTDDTMTSGVGTILWSAPEVLEGKQYDEKADIFSYGIVLSEIDTCALPYGFNKDKNRSKMKSMQIVHLVAQGKLLPTFRDDCPPEVVELARQCLDLDPAQRPTALQVVFTLRSKVFPLLNNGLTCSG